MNLARILADGAAAWRDRPAVLFEQEIISYGELDRRAAVTAAALRADGVQSGDRVAIKLPNAPAFVAAYFGALRAGAIVVPLNVLLAPPEVEERLAASTPVAVVDRELPIDGQPLWEMALRADDDAATLLFTSGTTGRSKGAILTHGSIRAAARSAVDALAFGPEDVQLGVAPFSHVLGLSVLIATFMAGAAVAAVPRFDAAQTLATMTATQTTVLVGVPTMCIALCEAARSSDKLPPVRIAHVGGAAVPVEVARDVERTFGCAVHEGYGLTELSGLAATYTIGQPRKPRSVGMPLGGTEIRIADPDQRGVGEVQFRGPSVIPGYWNDSEATRAAIGPDGWLSTGDVGYLDEQGYLFLVDRKKEMIIRGGYNIYPGEVEEVLYAHPDVLEAAVVGMPDETLGEEVAALVVPRPGAAVTPGELQTWAKERVAAYKYPRRVVFVEELPKGPTGKILKRSIKREALPP
jgi:long-chain acyl-CoA synthetase